MANVSRSQLSPRRSVVAMYSWPKSDTSGDNHVIDKLVVLILAIVIDRRYILCVADSSIQVDEVYPCLKEWISSASEGVYKASNIDRNVVLTLSTLIMIHQSLSNCNMDQRISTHARAHSRRHVDTYIHTYIHAYIGPTYIQKYHVYT